MLTIITDLKPYHYTSVTACHHCVRYIHTGQPVSGGLIARIPLSHSPDFRTAVGFQNANFKMCYMQGFS